MSGNRLIMIKALLKLCLLGMIPLIFLVISDGYGPLRAISDKVNEEIFSNVYLGTFRQLEQKLDGLSDEDLRLRFEELTEKFGMEIRLRELNELTSSESKIRRLNQGEVVSVAGDGNVLAYKLGRHDLVVTMAIDETPTQDVYRSASGSLFLVKMELENLRGSDLERKVADLAELYGFRIELVSVDEFHTRSPDIKLNTFSDAGWSWYRDEDDNEVFVVPTGELQYVVLYPLQAALYLTFLIVTVIAIFFLALAIGVSLWLWPLWRDHKKLTRSALAFGAGQLDTRVEIKSGSFAADIGRSFNQMADNVQQLISANQQLTNAVAHDLRTPLARLRFANEILDSGDFTPEEATRYRSTINNSIDALDYLINQTLLHSRYTRSTDIKQFRHTEFARTVLAEVEQFDFEYGDLEFQTKIDESLLTNTQFVDDKALVRALSNLLNNAARHAKSFVKVSYFMAQDRYCLRVEDDGHGIDEKDVDRIMQPYAQLGNDQRDHNNGLGLGLAIVYQITKWHKGKVTVEKSDLGGARFSICWSPISLHG